MKNLKVIVVLVFLGFILASMLNILFINKNNKVNEGDLLNKEPYHKDKIGSVKKPLKKYFVSNEILEVIAEVRSESTPLMISFDVLNEMKLTATRMEEMKGVSYTEERISNTLIRLHYSPKTKDKALLLSKKLYSYKIPFFAGIFQISSSAFSKKTLIDVLSQEKSKIILRKKFTKCANIYKNISEIYECSNSVNEDLFLDNKEHSVAFFQKVKEKYYLIYEKEINDEKK
jgi:hypothetical protein